MFLFVDVIRYTQFNKFKNADDIHRFTMNEFYVKCVKRLNPMALITGFAPVQIKFCLMHSVHLGICQWLNASAIYELISYGYFGDPPLSQQLHVMTQRLNRWCSFNGIQFGSQLNLQC